jgi:hypothetical protein
MISCISANSGSWLAVLFGLLAHPRKNPAQNLGRRSQLDPPAITITQAEVIQRIALRSRDDQAHTKE